MVRSRLAYHKVNLEIMRTKLLKLGPGPRASAIKSSITQLEFFMETLKEDLNERPDGKSKKRSRMSEGYEDFCSRFDEDDVRKVIKRAKEAEPTPSTSKQQNRKFTIIEDRMIAPPLEMNSSQENHQISDWLNKSALVASPLQTFNPPPSPSITSLSRTQSIISNFTSSGIDSQASAAVIRTESGREFDEKENNTIATDKT